MQYVFFEQGICNVHARPQKLGKFLRIFVLKVTLQSARLLLTVSYTKKLEEQDVLVTPPVILLRAAAAPVPAPMAICSSSP